MNYRFLPPELESWSIFKSPPSADGPSLSFPLEGRNNSLAMSARVWLQTSWPEGGRSHVDFCWTTLSLYWGDGTYLCGLNPLPISEELQRTERHWDGAAGWMLMFPDGVSGVVTHPGICDVRLFVCFTCFLRQTMLSERTEVSLEVLPSSCGGKIHSSGNGSGGGVPAHNLLSNSEYCGSNKLLNVLIKAL